MRVKDLWRNWDDFMAQNQGINKNLFPKPCAFKNLMRYEEKI
jgi:hypothetical protein